MQSLRADDSIEDVICRYKKTVYGIALTHVKRPQDADDVFQEVFLAYCRRSPHFNDEEHRKAWLIRAALNHSKKLAGGAWKRRAVSLDDMPDETWQFNTDDENLVFNGLERKYWVDGKYITENYRLSDTAVIWDMLLIDMSAGNEGDGRTFYEDLIDISIDVKVIGSKNIPLAVSGDGYVHTNILGTQKCFFIGADSARSFADFVLQNGTLESSQSFDGGSAYEEEPEMAAEEAVVAEGYTLE